MDNVVRLTEDSVQNLMEHFRHRTEFGTTKANVSLSVEDMNLMIQTYLTKCWPQAVKDLGLEGACFTFRGNAIDRIERVRCCIQTGIELMLMDDTLDFDGSLLRQKYIDRDEISNCFYEDRNQVPRPVWTYLVWMDILNEMLQEFVVDVDTERSNQFREWMSTNVFGCTNSGELLWSFHAFLRRDNPDDQQLIHKLCLTCKNGNIFYNQGDFYDMGPVIRVSRIFPRFYYELGRLFNGKTSWPLERLSKINGIKNLHHYRIGVS